MFSHARIFPIVCCLASCLAIFASKSAQATRAPLRTAFLPFMFTDTSLPAPGAKPEAADVARLHTVDTEVQQRLVRSGEYVAVDTARIARAIHDNDLVGCDSCAVSLAREVGAEAVLYGWVQKVSDLIINMTILVRSVKTGQIIAAGNASIRGDTDIAWKRGAAWLIAHRLLPAEAGR